MMAEQHTGGAYSRWSEDLRKQYIGVISDARLMLKQIPRWEGSNLIFDSDVDDLVMLCEMFNVDIDEIIHEIAEGSGRMKFIQKIMDEKDTRSLLYDMSVFKAIKGRIYKVMRDIVEEKLKPTDPLLEKMEKLEELEDHERREVYKEEEEDEE